MSNLPSHALPNFTDAAVEDALFHYTTANGLIGLLTKNEIWSTAYWCANDESELVTGKGVLTPMFKRVTHALVQKNDALVQTFASRGVDIETHAESFEHQVLAMTFNVLSAYITCFCKPLGEEDFLHGLLSQWRGYGTDGGYALQFSRKKLEAAVAKGYDPAGFNYELQDVYYSPENPLKEQLLNHREKYEQVFLNHLEERAKPLDFNRKTRRSPVPDLLNGPLEALLDYMIQTKNKHFSEERECRLSILQSTSEEPGLRPLNYFNRAGMIVPYVKTESASFDILDCLDWIVVGPGPRMGARFNSVVQMVKRTGRRILVRPSHIPLARQ